MMLLRAHRVNGIDGVSNSAWKWTRLKLFGMIVVDTTLPSGFSDADTM